MNNMKLYERVVQLFIFLSCSLVLSPQIFAQDLSDFDWADEKPTETTEAVSPEVSLIPGAKPVDPEATSYSGLFSDQNYLVKEPVEKVKRFYLKLDGKFCSIDDEGPMAFEEGEFMMTSILCLNHAGKTRAGDNVTAITIFKAPAPILSDLIRSTQGDWTIISIDIWVEEDY